ncbi:DUF551 domain-containing protein [Holdemanella biformis]|uniref:DUF551 domain-containing protein n=1 Tax=Holdemanella biformis TaxID=1735 RepID=A0A395WBY6_9FIRM|nr:DUF551 domain-containing protein [Holdemanella biformis]RGU94015.1 DUF551 domain-containing protein [Holdemanella biformis]
MNKYQKAFNTITNTLICYMIRRDLYSLPSDDEIYNAQMVLLKLVDKADSFEWIPISERLPEEHDSIFAKSYGTDKWDNRFWRTTSNRVIATIKYNDGTVIVKEAFTHDGEWTVEKKSINCKVIAWMPLPEPYKEKENETR